MLPNTEVAMSDFRLVDKKGLKTIYGIPYCSQHIARLEKAGEFPKRLHLGPCRVAWYCSEIEAWIASRRS
jgi:prophage regulatory protein